jgi:type II secretory pathway component PulL
MTPKVEVSSTAGTYNSWLMDNALALALLEAEGKGCPNFHRSSSPFKNFWTSYHSYISVPVSLLILALFLGMGGVILENVMLQKQVDKINTQMKAVFNSAFPDTKPLNDTLAHMKSRIKELQTGSSGTMQGGNSIKTIDILNEISRLIPKEVDVHFVRMVVGENAVTISGKASAFNIVNDVKSRLEQCQWFKQVEIASANMDKSGDTVSFKFTIGI